MNTTSYSPNSTAVSSSNSGTAAPTGTASFSAGAKTPSSTPYEKDKADVTKEKLSDKVQQLGHGLKDLFHLPEQVRRHPLATAIGGTAAVLVVGGGITFGILESQRRRTFSYRFMKGLHKATQALSL